MACDGVVRSTVGSVFPLFGLQMYENLGIPWATCVARVHLFGICAHADFAVQVWPIFKLKSKPAWSENYE